MHSEKMSPLTTKILELVSPMDECQIVDEMNIACLQRDLDAMFFCDCVK